MNYFELYPGDYLRDTSRLTLLEHGVYLRMLMTYYGEEVALPGDDEELFVIVCAITDADKAAVRKVANRFFPKGDDGLRHNARADKEIEKARKRIDTARKNGSKNKNAKDPVGNPSGKPAGDPAGIPVGDSSTTQRVTQWDTQRHTHSGEALHTPHEELPTANAVGAKESPNQPPLLPNNVTALPVDPKVALWSEWKKLSGDDGAFLGRMVKAHGEGAVLAAVATVLTKRPAEPKSFLRKLLEPNPGKRGRVDAYGWILDEHGNRTGKRGAVV